MSHATSPSSQLLTFTDEPLHFVVSALQAVLEARPQEMLEFCVLNPDLGQGYASGAKLEHSGVSYRYRPYRSWFDLAERLACRFLTPVQGGTLVRLRFLPHADALDVPETGERACEEDPAERYGPASAFGSVQKLEEPCFLLDYSEALLRTQPPPGGAVLDLGVNTGDEFARFGTLFGAAYSSTLRFTGIDRSKSALDQARARFPDEHVTFLEADFGVGLEALRAGGLGRFELVVCVATLQSPGMDGREIVRQLVQHHLTPTSGLILGFPNCRYSGGEVVYGARIKNFRRPDLSLLIKDLMFYKKYLQQHRFKVFLTGKYYLFLTAVQQA